MIQGRNIILRPLKMTDWENTVQWRNDIIVKKMAMMHPFPVTEMAEREWYDSIMKDTSNKSVYFAISIKDDYPIGFVSLTRISYTNRNCYLSIVIGEAEERGKGYGKEAMELLLDYAFNTLNLHKVTVEVVDFNKNALEVYRQLGFYEEGRLKQHYYSDGAFYDVLLMSVFRELPV